MAKKLTPKIRKRRTKKLVELLARPPIELDFFTRVLLWIFRSDASSALTIGILFVISTVINHIVSDTTSNLQRVISGFMALLIFGVFLGVIGVTETENHYKNSGSRIRIITGAISFCAISVMFAAPLEGVVSASALGAILGYFGIYWAKHL